MGAGSAPHHRALSRTSSHRQALLRNQLTSLMTHESIATTWPKAKETQRLADKLITLGKRNTEASRRRALSIFYRPHDLLPKLFGELRERYRDRPGGYTRVLRIEPLKMDQAPSAILELVDGRRDMRFAMTAQAVARDRVLGRRHSELTRRNVRKVTRYRAAGAESLEGLVGKFRGLEVRGWDGAEGWVRKGGRAAEEGIRTTGPRTRAEVWRKRGKGSGKGRFVEKREVYGNVRDFGFFDNTNKGPREWGRVG